MSRIPAKRAVSAGGVVFTVRDNVVYVVICGRIQSGTWTLPKGTPAKAEEIEEAAVREVEEETGLSVEIVAKLGEIDYWFMGMPERVRYHKVVYLFLMRPTGGDISRHDWEFDVVEWVPIGEASDLLSYENEREILLEAEQVVGRLEGQRGRTTSNDAAV